MTRWLPLFYVPSLIQLPISLTGFSGKPPLESIVGEASSLIRADWCWLPLFYVPSLIQLPVSLRGFSGASLSCGRSGGSGVFSRTEADCP